MKRLFTYLLGNSPEFSLNYRISNAILLLSVLFGIQSTIGNIMLDLPVITIIASALAGVVLFFLYYISRFKNKREIAVILALSLSVVFYIPIMWIGNGGSIGGMVYYIFLYGAFTMSALDGKKSFIFIGLFITVSFLLYILEYNHQIKIYDYNTPFDRLADILISFVFVLLGISITIYIYKSQYQKSNTLLEGKNIELSQLVQEITSQRDEIETQRDEIITQRDRVSEQNKIISKQNRDIKDSINYAKKIQNAVLPQNELLQKILNNFFIIYKPKDVVSGDFYWVAEVDKYKVIVVADCTGHGVPGGFMSMLGVSFLNEIILKDKILQASKIIHTLRKYIIYSLKQQGNIGEQADGMDLSVCVLNTETYELEYSGANNSIYIVSKNNLAEQNPNRIKEFLCTEKDIKNKLYQIFPDKMPVSYYVRMDRFTNVNVKLQKNDCLYMLTDGYADQFGGNKGRKLGYKRLRKTILINSCTELTEQKAKFNEALDNWQASTEQIDDITVLAVKI